MLRRGSARAERLRRVGVGVVSALAASAGLAPLAGPVGATATFELTRLAGADRYDTAGIIASNAFPTTDVPPGADTVFLASGRGFADALAASYPAGARNAAILLTGPDSVPSTILAALRQVRARNVVLLGLGGAISPAVEDTLKATDSTAAGGGKLAVTRIGGGTRYATMQLLAAAAGGEVGTVSGKRTAIVATGERFPDALAAAPLAYARRLPIILTTTDGLAAEAAASLTERGIEQVVVAGGSGAISPATEAAIRARGIAVLDRLAGTDRSDTSRRVANFAIDNLGFSTGHFNLATGEDDKGGADALTGGVHGGREDPPAPTLVTNTATDAGAVLAFAAARVQSLADGHVFGGDSAVSPAVLESVVAAARGASVLTITSGPGEGAAITTSTPTFRGSASDPDGTVTTIEVAVDGGGFSTNGVACTGCGSPTPTFTFVTPQPLSPGGHTVSFRAQDSQGGLSAVVTRSFTVTGSGGLAVSSAQVNPAADRLRLTFSQAVTCPAGARAAFSYDDLSFFNDTNDNAPVPSVTQVGPDQCDVAIGGNLQADEFGSLSYVQPADPAARITDAGGGALESAVFGVPDTIAPRLDHFAVTPAAGASSLSVAFAGATASGADDADGIACNTATPSDFVVHVGGATAAVNGVECTGTLGRELVLVLASAVTGGQAVTVQVPAGAVVDEAGNLAVANTITATAT